jgi:hypothetical protein
MFRGQDIPQIMQVRQFRQSASTRMLSAGMAEAAQRHSRHHWKTI